MSFEEIQSFIDFLKSLSLTAAALVAVWGIRKWRHETRWKRKYEVAEATMVALLQARDRLSQIRSPFGMQGEGSSRVRNENETEEERKRLDRAYVGTERLNNNRKPFDDLQEIQYRFAAIFGEEYLTTFQKIPKIINRIIHAYYEENAESIYGQDYYGDDREKRIARRKENRSLMFERDGDLDPINIEFQEIIDELEKKCFPILKRK